MIVFEERIQSIVDSLPQIDGFDVNFEWVKDSVDVNRYLALDSQPYPIIFLLTGKEKSVFKYENEYQEINRNCRFILATRELDVSLINSQRTSYVNVLNPLLEEFLELLDSSNISRMPNGFEQEKVPNYNQGGENGQIDIWDAIVLDVELVINSNCLN